MSDDEADLARIAVAIGLREMGADVRIVHSMSSSALASIGAVLAANRLLNSRLQEYEADEDLLDYIAGKG